MKKNEAAVPTWVDQELTGRLIRHALWHRYLHAASCQARFNEFLPTDAPKSIALLQWSGARLMAKTLGKVPRKTASSV